MKTIFPILIVLLLSIASCGGKEKSKQEVLLDKVMAVHDEVMPKMGDLMSYKRQLNERIEELHAEGIEDNASKIAQLRKAADDLQNSHDEMMSWMHQFDKNFKGMVEKEIMDYLKDQMKKIEQVGVSTNNALKNAEELLAK